MEINMETKILGTDENSIAEAGRIIARGGLLAFPTETVYGLGADAYNAEAAGRIYAAKGRPSDNPLIVHIADPSEIKGLASEISGTARRLIAAFMPGPFTIIVKKSERVPDAVTAGMATVAVRCPENETARRLIRAAGVPVAAPSANLSGRPSPTTSEHVIADMTGRIDAIIDGGDCAVGVESTIVDATRAHPVLLRPGGVTLDELLEIAPDTELDKNVLSSVGEGEQPLCPGMKYKHYSPEAEVIVVEGEPKAVKKRIDELLSRNADKVCGVLTMGDNAYDSAVLLSGGKTNREYARSLFWNLREFDRLGVELVFAEFESRDGMSLAVRNRLYKAAGQRVIRVSEGE